MGFFILQLLLPASLLLFVNFVEGFGAFVFLIEFLLVDLLVHLAANFAIGRLQVCFRPRSMRQIPRFLFLRRFLLFRGILHRARAMEFRVELQGAIQGVFLIVEINCLGVRRLPGFFFLPGLPLFEGILVRGVRAVEFLLKLLGAIQGIFLMVEINRLGVRRGAVC